MQVHTRANLAALAHTTEDCSCWGCTMLMQLFARQEVFKRNFQIQAVLVAIIPASPAWFQCLLAGFVRCSPTSALHDAGRFAGSPANEALRTGTFRQASHR